MKTNIILYKELFNVVSWPEQGIQISGPNFAINYFINIWNHFRHNFYAMILNNLHDSKDKYIKICSKKYFWVILYSIISSFFPSLNIPTDFKILVFFGAHTGMEQSL